MSVQSGPTFKRYAANGVTTVYAIPFLLLDAADLLIALDGVEVVSGFVLTGVGNPSSTCTFSAAPTGDLLFQLSIPLQRLADYQENGDLLSGTLNNDLDRLWLAIKQLSGGNDRALSTGVLEPEGIPALPVAAARALKLLAFDAGSNPVASTLTLDQLEQQPAIAKASADAAELSASQASSSAGVAAGSAIVATDASALAKRWASEVEDTPVSGGLYSARHYAAKAAGNSIWGNRPIGEPFPIWDHLAGAPIPPTNNSAYRYIKLTASDSYNTGALTSESVSGSAPLVIATAVINDALSPINGRTVPLINTERRALRAGSSGTVEADAFQGHWHNLYGTAGQGLNAGNADQVRGGNLLSSVAVKEPISDGSNGTPRIANETRAKNVGATFYMRIR